MASRAKHRGAAFLAGLALAAAVSAAASAAGEHDRRLGAEAAILLGDARRLAAPAPEPQRVGLVARIRGGLSGLPLLVRQARESNPALPPLASGSLADIRKALAEGNLQDAIAGLAALSRAYPFDTSGILPADATPERLRLGRSIHQETCAGCHDRPDEHAALPAHDLFRWARALPEMEFAARLYAGVRGDALTALANPLGAAEIAALIVYYREGGRD